MMPPAAHILPKGLKVVTAETSAQRQPSVCVLMTTHNRRDTTLGCLAALAVNRRALAPHYDLQAVLVDDGSTDGTAEAVSRLHGWVQVIEGDGQMYWCRGMHRAFERALGQGHDFYVWLNDDTVLRPEALRRLLECERRLRVRPDTPTIIVGSVVDPCSGALSYGGERFVSRWRRTTLVRVAPTNRPQAVDSMNGNLVLINAAAAERVGNLDPSFEHAMGDTDYALRARSERVGLWLAPALHGSCRPNDITGTYRDASLPLPVRWRRMLDRKGLPPRSWLVFTRRHTGWLWPLFFAWPYARLVVGALRSRR